MGEGGDHNIIGFICQRDFLQGLRSVQSKAPLSSNYEIHVLILWLKI